MFKINIASIYASSFVSDKRLANLCSNCCGQRPRNFFSCCSSLFDYLPPLSPLSLSLFVCPLYLSVVYTIGPWSRRETAITGDETATRVTSLAAISFNFILVKMSHPLLLFVHFQAILLQPMLSNNVWPLCSLSTLLPEKNVRDRLKLKPSWSR